MRRLLFFTLAALMALPGVSFANDDNVVMSMDPPKEGLMVFPGIRGDNAGPITADNRGSIGFQMGLADGYNDTGLVAGGVLRPNEETSLRVFGNARIDLFGEHKDDKNPGNGAEQDMGLSYLNAGIGYSPADDLFVNVALGYDRNMFHTMDGIESWGLHAEGGHKYFYGRFSYKVADDVEDPNIDSITSKAIGLTATYEFSVAERTGIRVSGHIDKPLDTQMKTPFGTVDGDDSIVKRVGLGINHQINDQIEIGAGIENTFSDDYEDQFSASVRARFLFGI